MSTTAKRGKRPEKKVPSLPRSAIDRGKALAARYQLRLWSEDGEWFAEGIEESGAMGDGRTVAQAIRNARYAMALAVATRIVNGIPLVKPIVDQERRQKAG